MLHFGGIPALLVLLGALAVCGWGVTSALLTTSASRGRPAAPPAGEVIDGLDLLFGGTTLTLCLAGLAGILLVELGRFNLWTLNLLLLLLGLGAFLSGVSRREMRPEGHRRIQVPERREWTALLLLALLCLVLFQRPHEAITGGADAGVYVNIGANLARTGQWFIDAPELGELDPALEPALFRPLPAEAEVSSILFPGFYRSDQRPDRLIPQFFTLHPLWLGIAYSLGATRAALWMTPIWGLLGVWATYMCARILIGARWAWLPALLLAVTPLQIYFARYPTAEPIAQFLVWTALWSFTAFGLERRPRPLFGLVAGLSIGSLFFARIDMIFVLLLPLIRGAVLLWTRRRPAGELWFWLPLITTTLWAGGHALIFARPYTTYTYGVVFRLLWDQIWLLTLLAAAMLLLLLYLATAQRTHLLALFRGLAGSRYVRHAAALLLVVLAVFGYFVRPALGETLLSDYWYTGTAIPLSNHLNMVRLGWFVTPLALLLGVVGGALMLERERWRVIWPYWILGASFTVLYLYNLLNNPVLIYGMRRYLPVTVPFLMLAVAYGLVRLWQLGPRGRGVAALLALALLGWLLYNNRLIWRQPDFPGTVAQIADLAGNFEENAVLLFVDEAPVGAGAIFGTPLTYLHGLTAFDLQEEAVDDAALARQVATWRDDNRAVYLLVREGESPEGIPLPREHLAHFQWQTSRLEQAYDHPPAMRRAVSIGLELYRIESP